MKKMFGVIVLSFILAWFIPLSFAQNATEMPNLTLKCLDATSISENTSQHFVELDGQGFEPNKPLEVWRDSEEGFVCAVDRKGESLCDNNALSAKPKENFQLLGMTKDQVLTNANGEIHLTKTRSRTKKRLTHRFYGAQKTTATTALTELPELTAEEYGLKLLTFLKEQETSSPSGASNCATVFFDPYGRVFDALSLEPIAGVSVYLLDQNKNRVPNQPGVVNPTVTDADGSFSFFVDDGTYYLDPVSPNYAFPLLEADIASLLGSQTTYYELYWGEPIVQQGQIQHRDIPLNPKDPAHPTENEASVLDKSISSLELNGVSYQKISGIVSHPKSLINIYSGTRLVATTTANQKGEFEVLIKNGDIDQTLSLDIVVEKVSLITVGFAVGSVYAEGVNEVSLYPQPNFLMGFIYDKNGELKPYSTVDIVIPKMNNRVYTSLRADSNAFIFVPHSLLPPLEYHLVAKSDDQTVLNEQSSFEFIEANRNFLNEEKINLLNPQTETVVAVAKNIKEKGISYSQEFVKPTAVITEAVPTTQGSSIYVFLTLLVILAVGALIVVLTRFRARYPSAGSL